MPSFAQQKALADRAEAEFEARTGAEGHGRQQHLALCRPMADRDSASAGLELLRIVDKIRRHVDGAADAL